MIESTNTSEDEIGSDILKVYPNPAVTRVHISMKNIERYEMIHIYNQTGISYPVSSIVKRSDLIEIDVSKLSPGAYFIRIVLEDRSKVIPIIKK